MFTHALAFSGSRFFGKNISRFPDISEDVSWTSEVVMMNSERLPDVAERSAKFCRYFVLNITRYFSVLLWSQAPLIGLF